MSTDATAKQPEAGNGGRSRRLSPAARGITAHFHLRGMGGTPKDAENLATIDSFVDTVSITVAQMVSYLRLHDLVERDPLLADWFRSTLA